MQKSVTSVEDSQSLQDLDDFDSQLTEVMQTFFVASMAVAHDTQHQH